MRREEPQPRQVRREKRGRVLKDSTDPKGIFIFCDVPGRSSHLWARPPGSCRMPNKLIMAAVEQLVASVGRELFNAMLIRKELCSFTSGENFHKGLEHVGSWLRRNSFSEDGLAHIMQAANFLNTSNKVTRRPPRTHHAQNHSLMCGVHDHLFCIPCIP